MGYSIAIHAAKSKDQLRVLEFFNKNLRSAGEVFGFDRQLDKPEADTRLSYDDHPKAVGFDCGHTSNLTGAMLYMALALVAIRLGKPAYYYDEEKIGIKVTPTPSHESNDYECDKNGFRPFDAKDYTVLDMTEKGKSINDLNSALKAESERLAKIWDEQ